MNNLRLDVAQLEQAIANLLVTYPELTDDETWRADTFEGSTNLHEVLADIVNHEREAKAMAGAVKERISELSARKARYERQEEAWRGLILKLMEHAGQAKVTLPEATLSLSHRKPAPVVTDETALPDECIQMIRKPIMATIRDWCEAGNVPDGVTIGNGTVSLTIRVK